MIEDKSILAVIPARGGSKRLPKKNILPLGGKPLIAWTIEAAKMAKYIDRVIVSTEDETIAEISRTYGAEIPFLRPTELAEDTTSTIEVLEDLLGKVQGYDYLLLLQPTSPLRTTEDITAAIEYMETKQADAVISVCETEHSPLWANTLPRDQAMDGFLTEEIQNKRSQDLPIYYRLNGAIYLVRIDKLLEEKKLLLKGNVYAYIMPPERSVDIDTKIDLQLCEVIKKG